MPVVTDLRPVHHGWRATVDGIPVYIRHGSAYWMKDRFDGQPLTMAQDRALDIAAMRELNG